MSTLIVEFHGICVHFNRDANPSLGLPAAHRIVLPYLPDGLQWNGQEILVHQPTVTVNGPTLSTTLSPVGVTLTLDQLTGQSEPTTTFGCSPNLRNIQPDMVLDPAVIVGGAAPAAIYFDISEGTLSGIDIQGSAGTRLTIETDLTEAVLNVSPWNGASTFLPLELPATIVVSNLAKDPTSDLAADFIISFAVGTPFPPEPTSEFLSNLQTALDAAMACLGSASQDIGPGCSNSQFP